VSPVKYELGFYIPEDGIVNSHSRENLKSYNSDAWFPSVFTSRLISRLASYTDSVLNIIIFMFSY
jgi:hypothetical protein